MKKQFKNLNWIAGLLLVFGGLTNLLLAFNIDLIKYIPYIWLQKVAYSIMGASALYFAIYWIVKGMQKLMR